MIRLRRPDLKRGLLVAPLPLGGCDALKLGIVNHAGPVAADTWHLYLIVGAVLVFVAGPVLILTPIMAWHYRLSNRNSAFQPKWIFSWPLEALIWLPPAGIVVGLGVVLWHYTHHLDPYRRLESTTPTLNVQAVALDWKWLFIYPDARVAAVNQLAIPVDTPVHIDLTSGTVMQSMLVPQLAGQIYAMAGMRTQLNLAATRPGTFRGENTQYNGDGFPREKFAVIAMPRAQYDAWLMRVRAAARPLDDTALTRLRARSVVARPVFFSSVPQGLFGHLMTLSTAPAPQVRAR